MAIEKFHLRNVRVIRSATIQPSPGINLIYGKNASGKSSLLEAIHILAQGRSFRTHLVSRVVTGGAASMILFARLSKRGGEQLTIGAERGEGVIRLRKEGRSVPSTAELARELPVQAITPEVHALVEQGPASRRRFLDWGVFHVEHGFISTWRRFVKALQQRNAALRTGLPNGQISVWHGELAECAVEMGRMRRGYLEELVPLARNLLQLMTGGSELELRYLPGWNEEKEDYAAHLQRSLDSDRRSGYTRHGPHRFDLAIFVDGEPARDRISRGEQKMLAIALRLAQAELLQSRGDREQCVLLVDDLASELDPERRSSLLRVLGECGCQVFITATDLESIEDTAMRTAKLFHVEHGVLQEVVQ